jgi:hypothetical protein
VRRIARGLGRLAGNASLLAVIGVAAAAAGGVDAAPAPQVFLLTISGASVATFDHTDCDTSTRSVGVRTAKFRSRPTLVRFAGGRVRTVVVRGMRGTVTLTGTNTRDVVCGTPVPTPEPCAKTTRSFADGRVTISSRAAGSITIHPPEVLLYPADCPDEPNEIIALPLGPAPGPLHISSAALNSPRTARISFTASARRTKEYGSLEAGFLQQRSKWTFTFVRTGR